MHSTHETPRYQAYVLRLWLSADEAAPMWRASLEDTRTNERRGFADVDSLCVFLKDAFQSVE